MRALTAACVIFGGLGLARADDPPAGKPPAKDADKPAALDRAELDQRIARVAYEAAKAGSQLWQQGDDKAYEGCFRLYQGTLLALAPMLDHRPKLAALVRDKLDKVSLMKTTDGAFVLREALDAVQKETAGPARPAPDPKKAVLWDRLGGEKVARAVAHDFVRAAAKDPKVDFTRGGAVKLTDKDYEAVEGHLVEVLSMGTGGHILWSGPKPETALAGTKFTDDEFAAMLGHLAAALKKNKVPNAETIELLEAVGRLKPFVVGR